MAAKEVVIVVVISLLSKSFVVKVFFDGILFFIAIFKKFR